jgi:hypothetical protein
MKTRWFIMGLVTLLASPGYAQELFKTLEDTLHTNVTDNAPGKILKIEGWATVVLQVGGIGTATVTFQVSQDAVLGWQNVLCVKSSDGTSMSSITADGAVSCPVSGYKYFRAPISGYSAGTINARTVQTLVAVPVALGGGGGGGGTGTVTSVSATGGVETDTGSPITGAGTIRGNTCVNAQTGLTYTVLSSDRGCFVTFDNAAAVEVILPQAGTAGFDAGFSFMAVNVGAGIVTIAPATSTIQGSQDLDVTTGKGVEIVSDGTNYSYNPGLGLTVETQGLSNVLAIDRIDGEAISEGTALQVGSAAANVWALTFYDATSGLVLHTCKASNVLHNCDKVTKVIAGKKFKVTDASDVALLDFDPNGATAKIQYALGAKKIRKYVFIPAGYLAGDGTNCPLAASAVTINGGPKTYTMICGSGADGDMDFDLVMDSAWDGGTLGFEPVYTQTSSSTGALSSSIKAQCTSSGETPSTWGASVAINDTVVTGLSASDRQLSAAVTPAWGCTGGDQLFVRYTLDVTGTTTPEATLHFYGIGMFYYVTSLGS